MASADVGIGTVTMRKLPLIVLGIAGTAGMLVACSSGGSATPTTSTSASTETTTSTAAVPTVAHPLDSSKVQSAPCSALTKAQVEAVGVPTPLSGSSTSVLGPGCTWTGGGTSGIGNGIELTWDTTDSNGLQFAYDRKSVFTYWTTTSVDGYPAVIGDVMDDRKSGSCSINVGVSDKMMFIARYDGLVEPQKSQSCQLVQQVADDIIKNLGG